MFEYLTGNVPGGFGLYLLFVAVTFLVLWGISRRNDLFTTRHFRIWFLSIWALATVVYAFIWLRNPSPAAFSRYSVQFYAAAPQDDWLALYLSDEMESALASQRSATNYFYPQRWNYLAGADCRSFAETQCAHIAAQLPIEELVVGELSRRGAAVELRLRFLNYPGEKQTAQTTLTFPANQPESALPELRRWLGQWFPFRKTLAEPSLPDSVFVHAKHEFWRGNYQKSLDLCQSALRRFPQNAEIEEWIQFNTIRIAAGLRHKNPVTNPFETKLKPWQQQLVQARTMLIPMAQANYSAGIENPLLNNMIAESFLLDKQYGDAEAFLKIAFGEDPVMIETLRNMLLLHPSRYNALPFRTDSELMRRILNICPFEETTLQTYIEKLLTNLQVDTQPAAEIRGRIERALTLAPESYTALLLKGKFHLAMFEYEPAKAAFEHADRVQPNRAVTQYNLGVVTYYQKDLAAAEAHFQRAVQLDDYLDAHLYLGVIYQQQAQYEKALERFRYRVANKTGDEDYYAVQAMKGIRECLKALNIPIPGEG